MEVSFLFIRIIIDYKNVLLLVVIFKKEDNFDSVNLPFRSLRVNFSAGGRGWCRLLLIFIPPVAAAAGAQRKMEGKIRERNIKKENRMNVVQPGDRFTCALLAFHSLAVC